MPFNWKNNYKLPFSFIIFFVLAFFLLGEQLPALPTYLFGPGIGGDGPVKLHILDLGLTDSLHRPVAYLIIGTVIWILFRIFTWPLAWFGGAVLWILEQQTLTPLDQRPTLINAIIFTFTFWVLLTLVPYFIFRWVDKKWGGVGIRNAILVVLVINLLVSGFFAYQIYVLNNSYRGLHKNTGQQGVSPKVLPPNTCPDSLMTEKDKQTAVYWNGKTLPVSAEEQKWVEKNCPGALQNP
ncbi:MAG: hypothetical protein HYW45_03235 [Candidatus Daviesbacteria bacterium]|nr:MAG: hypothetical protein HYW45_03235 [Candidatus Daviesbacteria bacterium]